MSGRRSPGGMVLSRQKLVGWLIIAVSVFYIAYFFKARLFAGGD